MNSGTWRSIDQWRSRLGWVVQGQKRFNGRHREESCVRQLHGCRGRWESLRHGRTRASKTPGRRREKAEQAQSVSELLSFSKACLRRGIQLVPVNVREARRIDPRESPEGMKWTGDPGNLQVQRTGSTRAVLSIPAQRVSARRASVRVQSPRRHGEEVSLVVGRGTWRPGAEPPGSSTTLRMDIPQPRHWGPCLGV